MAEEVKRDFRSYLGDSVYIDFDGYHLRLYTNNGGLDKNIICMEPGVVDALSKYINRIKAERR